MTTLKKVKKETAATPLNKQNNKLHKAPFPPKPDWVLFVFLAYVFDYFQTPA
jgi:hypothetical protein